jgi:hypothetical protein
MRALVFVSVLAVLDQALLAQVSLAPEHAALKTSDQLTLIVGTESAARAIVSLALREFLRTRPDERTTTMIAAQIPDHWLPAIPGVEFVRLPVDRARAHFQQCGNLLYVNSLTRPSDDVVVISIAEGDKCHSGGLDFRFRRSEDGWHLQEGLPGGFVGGVEACGCR